MPRYRDMSTLALAGRPPCDASVMMENVTVVRQMIEASWQPLLAAFQQVFFFFVAGQFAVRSLGNCHHRLQPSPYQSL